MGFTPAFSIEQRLAREIALLHRVLVGEERRDVEVVGADLVVAVAELGLEEEPPPDPRIAADHDRLALERGEAVVADALMRDQHGRVLLEHRRDRHHRDVLLGEVERDEGIGGDVEIEPAGGQKLRLVDLRPALAQVDLDARTCL